MGALPAEATLIDAVAKAVTRAAAHNPNDTVPPAVILWTDKERQWEPLLPSMRERLPLLTLGTYEPETLTGPAFWLRCAIAGVLELDALAAGAVPVIYLPGIARGDLRAVESCPKELQPLAELQYRGVFWTHKNGRDWTIPAFLQSQDGGLGIAVQGDAETGQALVSGLRRLAQELVVALRAAQPLRANYMHQLLNPDPGLRLLRWLNDPAREQAALSDEEWQAFLAVCKDRYQFRLQQDGPITGVRRLAERKGEWQKLWSAFAGHPEQYSGIIAHLDNEPPTQLSLFETRAHWEGAEDPRSSWPANNLASEAALRSALIALAQATPEDARAAILQLEGEHGDRRRWVWARLGRSPLAQALEPLADLATRTGQPLVGQTTEGIASTYASDGWRTDHTFLRALASISDASPEDVVAVHAAAGAVYRAWLEAGAAAFQQVILEGDDLDYPPAPLLSADAGTCILFVDPLRFDLGMELVERLQAMQFDAAITPRLAALPTVTPTAKPAVSPVARQLAAGSGFDAVVAAAGPKVTASVLAKLIADSGYQVMKGHEVGDPQGRAWTEHGQIDSYGHNNGWMVARHGRDEVERLAQRIQQLLAWGWKEVVVITDHGWLLLPDGLPTASLHLHLTEQRKGRCARLKEGAKTDDSTVPWHWDPTVRVAMASGIRCYEAGKIYEHGGLSPQECVTPFITVRKLGATGAVKIAHLRWSGLRCRVSLSAATKEMTIDLRSGAADPASTIADMPKPPDPDGTATIFLAGDQDHRMGEDAFIVVVALDGSILAQQQTTIGG